MSNMNENRINLTLEADDVTIINQCIATILSKLPANATLSADERISYNAIDVSNKVYVENVLQEATATGTGIIAAYVSLPALANDVAIHNQMNTMEAGLANVLQRVGDIKRISGHEAYKVSNRIYKNYQDAAEVGIDNAQSAYERLKVRFEGQGNPGRPVVEDL